MDVSRVAIQRDTDPFEGTLRLLDKTRFDRLAVGKKRILIKPNLTTAASAKEGITTDIRVVEALIQRLRDLGLKRIIVGEGSGGVATALAFKKNGYFGLERKYGVEVLDLNEDKSLCLPVESPLSIDKLTVSRTVYESDMRISVAKLKIHSIAYITGCLKNMMGALSGRRWKLIVHSDVHKRLVDLNKLVLPHFGVIDGIIGNEVDEVIPHPVRMNLLLGGSDVVAVDSVASEIMGIPWQDVEYLVRCQEAGLGVADINSIELIGGSVEDFKREFDRRRPLRSRLRTKSQAVIGRLASRFS